MGTIKINAAVTIQRSLRRGYIEVSAEHSKLRLHVRVAVTLRDEVQSRQCNNQGRHQTQENRAVF